MVIRLLRSLKQEARATIKFKEGTLYPALHRLEKAGLLLGIWQILPNGRQRRYYHITAKGHSKLAVEKLQWQDFLNAMNLIIQPASP